MTGTAAVVLSGGGAYGAYEVGVLNALVTGESPATGGIPLDVGVFTGTSVGAYNAAVMTMLADSGLIPGAAYLEEIWRREISNTDGCGNGVYRVRGNPQAALDPLCLARNPFAPLSNFADDAAYFAGYWLQRTPDILFSSGDPASRLARAIDFSAFLDIEPFRALITRTIDFHRIGASSRALRVLATNWETGEPVVFDNHHLTVETGSSVIQASAAIPGLFPPVHIGEDVFVDGGVIVNTPLECAIQAGASELHVIYMDPDVQNIPLRRLQNTASTFDRVYTIMLATKINEDIDTAAWINEGIEAVRRLAAGKGSGRDEQLFMRVAGQLVRKGLSRYRPITIHRYHPHADLGGTLGMLNFSSEQTSHLIEQGFIDAAKHDCAASHCIIPAIDENTPKESELSVP